MLLVDEEEEEEDEEPMQPLSVSLNTLSLSRSETMDEPRSVMLSARLLQIWSMLMDEEEEMLLCGLMEEEGELSTLPTAVAVAAFLPPPATLVSVLVPLLALLRLPIVPPLRRRLRLLAKFCRLELEKGVLAAGGPWLASATLAILLPLPLNFSCK